MKISFKNDAKNCQCDLCKYFPFIKTTIVHQWRRQCFQVKSLNPKKVAEGWFDNLSPVPFGLSKNEFSSEKMKTFFVTFLEDMKILSFNFNYFCQFSGVFDIPSSKKEENGHITDDASSVLALTSYSPLLLLSNMTNIASIDVVPCLLHNHIWSCCFLICLKYFLRKIIKGIFQNHKFIVILFH